MTPQFSIIIPVYNRPQEVDELLGSLTQQTYKNFEIIIVEDGSQQDCQQVVNGYEDRLTIQYFSKDNSGPGDSRNFGMSKARGDYFIFFDSDCLIPADYLEQVHKNLQSRHLEAYGGPDRAHPSFTSTQKAINYAMTSLLTTGGIRGGKRQLDAFQPRSFNMGIHKKIFEKVGGFSQLHPGEDPDWSYRIQDAGFKTGLIPEAYVYHKRRIDFRKFRMQVYKFGLARTILMRLHPRSKKAVYALPSLALIMGIVLIVAGFFNHYFWWPLFLGLIILLLDALIKTGNPFIALKGLAATIVQVFGYGWGFFKGYWFLHLLGRDPQEQFPQMYFELPEAPKISDN